MKRFVMNPAVNSTKSWSKAAADSAKIAAARVQEQSEAAGGSTLTGELTLRRVESKEMSREHYRAKMMMNEETDAH